MSEAETATTFVWVEQRDAVGVIKPKRPDGDGWRCVAMSMVRGSHDIVIIGWMWERAAEHERRKPCPGTADQRCGSLSIMSDGRCTGCGAHRR